MKVVTWNVNSINVRLPNILKYLVDYQPDVLCLQELKCMSDKYPFDALNEAGYFTEQSCQKTYNGVSIISKEKGVEVIDNPVNISSDEKRSIAGTYNGLRIINFYVVNGQAINSDKYQHKLKWLSKAKKYISDQLKIYPNLIEGNPNDFDRVLKIIKFSNLFIKLDAVCDPNIWYASSTTIRTLFFLQIFANILKSFKLKLSSIG